MNLDDEALKQRFDVLKDRLMAKRETYSDAALSKRPADDRASPAPTSPAVSRGRSRASTASGSSLEVPVIPKGIRIPKAGPAEPRQ